jgi:hypothetical protein
MTNSRKMIDRPLGQLGITIGTIEVNSLPLVLVLEILGSSKSGIRMMIGTSQLNNNS